MSTKIIYKNKAGELISKQQALALGNYEVVTIVDGCFKSIMHHDYKDHVDIRENGILIKKDYTKEERSQWMKYFLDSNEVKEDVIEKLFVENDLKALYIYDNKQEANGFISYDREYYIEKNILDSIGKSVYDRQLNDIMSCELDRGKSEVVFPVSKEFKEIYNGYKWNLTFEYRKDLDEPAGYYLDITDWDNYPDDFRLEGLLDLLPNFFNDFPYYQFVLPLVPAEAFIKPGSKLSILVQRIRILLAV